MYLRGYRYIRHTDGWTIEGHGTTGSSDYPLLEFGTINLLVGQNASGKSKTLNSIRTIADLLSNEKQLDDLLPESASYILDFDNEGVEVRYELTFQAGKVLLELLVVGGETRLDRTKSLIYFEGLGNSLEFGVADDVLAATKRDRVQHPFLEDLYNWSKSIYHFRFGSNLGKDRFVRSLDDIKVDGDFSMKTTEEVLEAFLRGEKIVTDFEQIVRADMERIGYKLESIGPEKVQFLPINIFGLAVKEADLWTNTHQFDMSQGMFRALSLLIQLNLSLAIKTPSCILIDDIGEGLDFDRSKSLIALIIEKVKGSKVQLIMTTNDRFVMNNVPIEYWCVIQRKGNQSLFYNYKNSKATFDEFVYTGLNNFDFFATGFFEKGFEEFTASAK